MTVNKEIIQKKLKEDIFKKISEASDDLGVDTYVVGGYVRDLCLRRPVKKDIRELDQISHLPKLIFLKGLVLQ